MKTLILSRHEPTIKYIKQELDLSEDELSVRHTLNSTEIKDLRENGIGEVIGNAPLWLIREFNRQGIEYRDFSFRRTPPQGEELSIDQFDFYKPKIEPYTVTSGGLDQLLSLVNSEQKVSKNDLLNSL